MITTLPGYWPARIALISSGCRMGVAVGFGVAVRAWVDVAAGEAVSVGADSNVGAEGEAEFPMVPQAVIKAVKIIQTVKVDFALSIAGL